MNPAIMLLVFASLLVALPEAVAAAPTKKWKNASEVSVVSANGNSKTQTTSAKNAYGYQFDTMTFLDIEAGGLGARSEGKVSSEQYFASEKMTRKLDDRNYLFEKYRWDRNLFAGVAHRHDFSAGAGRELWKTPKVLLIVEAAPGYLNEERLHDRRKSFSSARGHSKYTYDFSQTVRFGQDVEYIQSLKDKRDNRANTETALTVALSSVFSLKNSFTWRHDSRPPTGTLKNDTILTVSLIASF